MDIQHLPDALFLNQDIVTGNLAVYPYQADSQQDKIKINLTQHVFSFLTTGQKEVHFSNTTVSVTNQQALLIGAGNCLMTDRLSEAGIYQSTLFFFPQKNLVDFLIKHTDTASAAKSPTNAFPYFVIDQDPFIQYFIQSLGVHTTLTNDTLSKMLHLKFEEIMLYLVARNGEPFLQFLQALAGNTSEVSFRKVVEGNLFSKLSLEEIAFLCNMSLSTFKRHFVGIYHETPGKWFQHQRLQRARELLKKGDVRASDIFMEVGYESLSNFSAAFKQEFGISPRQAVAN